MPSLQLDLAAAPDRETQRDLAARLTAIYAEVMDAPPEIVTVVFREAGVWRDGAPSALLMCDVRSGRPADTRAELSRRLIAACAELLGLDPLAIKVEFTQHAGDEMYHPRLGGFNHDWGGPE